VARHFSLGRSRWSLEGGLRLAAGQGSSARGISKLPPIGARVAELGILSAQPIPSLRRPLPVPCGGIARANSADVLVGHLQSTRQAFQGGRAKLGHPKAEAAKPLPERTHRFRIVFGPGAGGG